MAWWLWALGLAAAASRTTNPWLLVMITLVACLVVIARRSDAPWALSFKLYLWLGGLAIAIRVVFKVIFAQAAGGHVVLDLPEVPLPDWVAGITLLGPLTREALLSGLYEGMRLAAILICIGAANTLSNPRRLLASAPPALYEMGTTIVVALSLFPQLAESVQRVRRARHLRGTPPRGIRGLRSMVVPVMEDALERSLALAESMDARGYGRVGEATAGERRLSGTFLLASLVALCVGIYAFLDPSAPRWLEAPMLVAGALIAIGGFVLAGRRVRRTRYRPDPWRWPETITALSGVLAAVAVYSLPSTVLYVDVSALPPLTVIALLGGVIGVLPAFVTPMPPDTGAPRASSPTPDHEAAEVAP